MFPVLHHLISILHRLLPGPSVALLWSVLPHSSFCFVRSTSDTWILRILDGDEWQCKPGIIDNDCITFRCRKMFLQLSVKFTISQTYLSSMSCSAHGKTDNNTPLVTSHCSQSAENDLGSGKPGMKAVTRWTCKVFKAHLVACAANTEQCLTKIHVNSFTEWHLQQWNLSHF